MIIEPADLAAIATAVCDELEARAAGRPAVTPSPFLDVDEAASYIRAGKQRIYDLVSAGAIEPRRDGRRLLFHRDDLDDYLAGTGSPPTGRTP
ncbi:MAG: helix-turn-helix domain-containing protein [Solirubrobacteraceae bacterium]